LVLAQNSFTISGHITEAGSGERLIGATIYASGLQKGTVSNQFGFYSLTLPTQDSLALQVAYLGYEPYSITIAHTRSQRLDVALNSSAAMLQEIEITEDVQETQLQSTQMSQHVLTLETIKTTPMLGSEPDLMKTLQLLPGVSGGSEGSAGLFVRGGSPDQNLILLDGVPVYNVNHLFGFVSVFNMDAINHVEMLKGGIPARYGGRLSSVLNIAMKEGNLKESGGVLSLGPIATRFTYEAPIKKDKSSLIVSGRRSWIGDLMGVALGSSFKEGYNFYDLNAKYNTKLNEKNRLYVSVYTGRDKYFTKDEDASFRFRWGNLTSVLRWNKIISPKLFANFSAYYSRYAFLQRSVLKDEEVDNLYLARSGVNEVTTKADLDYAPTPAHAIKAGLQLSRSTYNPEVIQLRSDIVDTTFNNDRIALAYHAAAYVEDDIQLHEKFRLNLGLRAAFYHTEGNTFPNLQPRVAATYHFHRNTSLKASYTRNVQFLHLLTNSSIGLPTDLWVPSTKNIAPQRSDQVAIGLFRKLGSGLSLNMEGYYKKMYDLIEYAEGANYRFGDSQHWEDKVVVGKGESYGAEFFLEKTKGRLRGWLGYTLSWTYRQFDDIDQGARFPFRYDRRHDLSLLLSYRFTQYRSLSFTFVYNTGNAVTLSEATYQATPPPDWQSINSTDWRQLMETNGYIDQRNGFRVPAYHRMDISYQSTKPKRKKVKRTWILSLYNAYNHLNPYYIYEQEGRLKQVSLFPIIPSLAYKIEF
jgi:outer membrane cobalamin receptor